MKIPTGNGAGYFISILQSWYARAMKTRWANAKKPGFTIVEIIIVITVIAILAAISSVAYRGLQERAADKAIKADLEQVSSEMQRAQIKNNGIYPTTLPSTIKASPNVTLTLKYSGTLNYYGAGGPLAPVQNGVLMAQICQDLITAGLGKGVDQGGTTRDYITGCGNWNHNSMQFTGWDTRTFTTPLTDTALLSYANNFTASNSFHKAQEAVVRTFYAELVERQTRQGGTYPITSFYDYWANSGNGGVIAQPLPTPQPQPWYCVEAIHSGYPALQWHITDQLKIKQGAC